MRTLTAVFAVAFSITPALAQKTMHDFKMLSDRDQVRVCNSLATELQFNPNEVRRMLLMCSCLQAFVRKSPNGSDAENERVEKATSIRQAAAVCSRQ